jgi:hypothetical protein
MEIFIAVVTFIALVFATMILEYFGISIKDLIIKKVKKLRLDKRNKKINAPGLYNRLVDFYLQQNMIESLYLAEIGNKKRKIPFITRENWFNNKFRENLVINLSQPLKRSTDKVDIKFIKQRQYYGHALWDDPLFTLTNIFEKPNSLELEVGVCNYFQYVTFSGKLEEETYNSKTKLRKKFLSTWEQITSFDKRTFGLGTICLIAIRHENTYNFVLSIRSIKTVAYGGKIGGLPSFAYQPFNNDYQHEIDYNHQIMREIYEELYDNEELIHKNNHLAYNWFYTENSVQRLREALDKNQIEFIPLGIGIDALNGEPNLSFLILIKDREFWENEKSYMKINWESDDYLEKSFTDPFFENLIESDNWQCGSIFTISESIKYLNNKLINQ